MYKYRNERSLKTTKVWHSSQKERVIIPQDTQRCMPFPNSHKEKLQFYCESWSPWKFFYSSVHEAQRIAWRTSHHTTIPFILSMPIQVLQKPHSCRRERKGAMDPLQQVHPYLRHIGTANRVVVNEPCHLTTQAASVVNFLHKTTKCIRHKQPSMQLFPN